jgi:hypothetical protein
MSSAVFSTTAAQGRPFVFDAEIAPEVCPLPSHREPANIQQAFPATRSDQSSINYQKSKILSNVTSASRMAFRPAPEMVSSGIAAMDALAGGLPRGCLTEICGPASSGRTTVLLAALAAATRRGECCVIVDAGDALDPQSAAAAGVELERLLWVRCGENPPRRHGDTENKIPKHKIDKNGSYQPEYRLEQLLRAADLLLESGGFGLIVLDLGDLPPQTARHIPLTTWFRFRRAVEHTPTVLLAVERQAIAGSCSSLLIQLGLIQLGTQAHGMKPPADSKFPAPSHAQLLTELEITAELLQSRLERKPVRSAEKTRFQSFKVSKFQS